MDAIDRRNRLSPICRGHLNLLLAYQKFLSKIRMSVQQL
jgi:hypothetical protein